MRIATFWLIVVTMIATVVTAFGMRAMSQREKVAYSELQSLADRVSVLEEALHNKQQQLQQSQHVADR